MPYIIDGHNLIGRMTGLSLDDPDDEARLLQLLRTFCARRKTKATVYFDRGVPGRANPASGSGLTARFVVPPATADEAIVRHLDRLGGEARNWVVVSSDSSVAEAARRRGARVWSSEDFTRAMATAVAPGLPPEKPDVPPDADELSDWERLFRSGRRRPG